MPLPQPRQLLATSSLGTVEQTAGGNVQVTVGFVTFHLGGQALEMLAETLHEAVRQKRINAGQAGQNMRILLGEADALGLDERSRRG